MLLDKYAKSVYVPSKDVYFVALYYHYGKFTEMTPFEKKICSLLFWRALYQNVLLPVTFSPYRTLSNDKCQLNTIRHLYIKSSTIEVPFDLGHSNLFRQIGTDDPTIKLKIFSSGFGLFSWKFLASKSRAQNWVFSLFGESTEE